MNKQKTLMVAASGTVGTLALLNTAFAIYHGRSGYAVINGVLVAANVFFLVFWLIK